MIRHAAKALSLGGPRGSRSAGGVDWAPEAGESILGAAVDVADRGFLVQLGEDRLASVFDLMIHTSVSGRETKDAWKW